MKSNWTTTACTPKERPLLSVLLSRARWQHRHVDWISALDMISQQPFLLAAEGKEPIGCLACPPDPPGVAWLRLFAVAPRYEPADLWELLWPLAEGAAAAAGATRAAVLLMGGWLVPFLMRHGFRHTNSVVFLERRIERLPVKATLPGSTRTFQSADLPVVVQLDHQAFDPIWRYSSSSMLAALTHGSLAMVAEQEGQIIGYVIVSSSALGTHIARLAVAPTWQGQGFGGALARRAMEHAFESGARKLTVNTQVDNLQAQSVYRSLGFQITDQSYPVWEKQLS